MSFEKMNIRPEIISALKEIGIESPTKIQTEAIPMLLSGSDVIGMSKTGSGKTAAFGIPVLEQIVPRAGLQAIIMSPTRELAVQISQEMEKFGKNLNIKVATIFGGVGMDSQVRDLKRSEIVVGTPGRLLDHMRRRSINLSKIRCAVLDEADRMVDMGFIKDVENIIRGLPKERQMLLFGATLSEEIEYIKNRYMKTPKIAKADSYVKQEFLKQYYYNIEAYDKFSLLVHLLNTENAGRSIIFCAKRGTVERLTRNLKRYFNVEMIHGRLTQSRRLKVIDDFKKGKPSILVASSVAARGLDIRDLTHVFNYELSRDPQEYIHRVGRTARAGDKGKAITLLSPQDHDTFNSVLRNYPVDIEAMPKTDFARLKFEIGQDREHFGGQRSYGPRQYGARYRRGN